MFHCVLPLPIKSKIHLNPVNIGGITPDLESLKPAGKTPKKGTKRTLAESVQAAGEALIKMARQ